MQVLNFDKQTMRCKETPRQRGSHIPKAVLAQEAEPHEIAAYEAAQGLDDAHDVLLAKLAWVIEEREQLEGWRFYNSAQYPQRQCLAKLVVCEFLHPELYRKHQSIGSQLSITALADAMHMDRRTFKAAWLSRFVRLRPVVRKWYAAGQRHAEL